MSIPVHNGEKKNAPIIQKEKVPLKRKTGLRLHSKRVYDHCKWYNQLTDSVTLRQEPPLQGYFEKISTFAAHSSRTQVVFCQNFLTPTAQLTVKKGNNHKPFKYNQLWKQKNQQTWNQILGRHQSHLSLEREFIISIWPTWTTERKSQSTPWTSTGILHIHRLIKTYHTWQSWNGTQKHVSDNEGSRT